MPYRPQGNQRSTALEAQRIAEEALKRLETTLRTEDQNAIEELEKVVADFERSLKLLPDQPSVLYNISYVQGILCDFHEDPAILESYLKESTSRLKHLLELTPEDKEATDMLGCQLFRRAHNASTIQERVQFFDETISVTRTLFPNIESTPNTEFHLKGLSLLGLAYAHRGVCSEPKEKPEFFMNAAKVLGKINELDPNDLSIAYNYANALIDVGKSLADEKERLHWFDRSIAVHKSAVQLYESNDQSVSTADFNPISLKYNLACVLCLKGDSTQALDILREICAEDSDRFEQAKMDEDFASIYDSNAFKKIGLDLELE